MTVAPPLGVSTQAKLVFPFAPLAGYPDRGGGFLPRGISPWRGALCSRPLRNREPCRLVPLSRHPGRELSSAGRFQAPPPLEFSGEARMSRGRDSDADENGGTLLAASWARVQQHEVAGIVVS
jgi:hypothetical protein